MRAAALALSAGLAAASANAGGPAGAPQGAAYVQTDVLKVFCAPQARLFSVEEIRIEARAGALPGAPLARNATGVVEARAGLVRRQDASLRLTLASCELSDGVTVSIARTAYQDIRPRELCRSDPYAAYEIQIGQEPAIVWPSRLQQCMDGRREDRALELRADGANTLVVIGICRYSQSGDRLCVHSRGGAVAPGASAPPVSGKPAAGQTRP